MPLAEPFRISGGTLAVRRSLIVEITSTGGAVGYGESAPFEAPFYSEETLSSARACIHEHLAPRLAGRRFAGLEAAVMGMSEGIRGNRFARAGVDTALWDLLCAQTGLPLRDLLAEAMERMGIPPSQRESRDAVDSGAALGIPDGDGALERLAAQAKTWLARGARRIKIKVQPGWDIEPVRAVRRVFEDQGLTPRVWADANGAYDRTRDRAALRALDAEWLELLEQPLPPDDVLGMLGLAHELKTPVCLDESLHDARAADLFVANGATMVWNLKVQRVGGLSEALRIYARAVAAGIPLWGGTMPETGVGSHAIIALGSFAGFTLPSDVTASTRWYEPGTDVIDIALDADGRVPVIDAPGLASLGLAQRLGTARRP